MKTCSIANPKSALPPVHCNLKAPVKTTTKAPVAKKSSVQQGNPSSSLKLVTGGKAQAKPAAKNGDIILAEDKIQAQRKPTVQQSAAKKAQAKKFIDDFGMIKVAKVSGKDIRRSVWGHSPLPSQLRAKQGQGKH